jgi:hypothetical protein
MNNTSKASIKDMKAAIDTLIAQSIKPTQKNVVEESKLSIITVRRHWNDINRLSSSTERISSSIPQTDKRLSSSEKRISSSTQKVMPQTNRLSSSTPQIENRVSGSYERFKLRAVKTPKTYII